MICHQKPDIVVVTESWLHAGIENQEIFPTCDYQVFRRDREKENRMGAVFILVKKELTVTREEELETDCEILWCKVALQGSKSLHIAAYCRFYEKDEYSLGEFGKALSRLGGHNGNVIITRDFNFPGWDWRQNIMRPDCHYPTLHNSFLILLNDTGLIQIVEQPTREKNTLDLCCTNMPGKFNKIEVIPGISDDCAVEAEVEVKPIQWQQRPRRIQLYKKADWHQMAIVMHTVEQEVARLQHSKAVNELWLIFKEAVTNAIDKCIPVKNCKSREQLPYR